MLDPNSPVPPQYITMIAQALPIITLTNGVEEQIRANQRQAEVWAGQIWRHAFNAGAAYGMSIAANRQWVVVTPEERERLVASLRGEEISSE